MPLAGEEWLLPLDVPHLDGAVHRAGGEHAGRAAAPRHLVEGDPSRWQRPSIYFLDLRCSAILPGQQAATVAAYQLPELSELSQREVLTILIS